jgi:hypothetical protein
MARGGVRGREGAGGIFGNDLPASGAEWVLGTLAFGGATATLALLGGAEGILALLGGAAGGRLLLFGVSLLFAGAGLTLVEGGALLGAAGFFDPDGFRGDFSGAFFATGALLGLFLVTCETLSLAPFDAGCFAAGTLFLLVFLAANARTMGRFYLSACRDHVNAFRGPSLVPRHRGVDWLT